MRTSFLHRFKAFCGNHYCHFFAEFGNEKGLLLKVYLAAALAGRVEFSCTYSIRIPSANEARFTCDVTNSSHILFIQDCYACPVVNRKFYFGVANSSHTSPRILARTK